MNHKHNLSAPHDWIEVDGASVPHWRFGNGPPVLFVHGWPLDCRTWLGVVEALAGAFSCHLIDLPGAGQSRWSEETPFGIQPMGRVIADCVDAIGADESVILVGHDSGGTYVRAAAALRPSRIRGLVLGNTEMPYAHSLRFRALVGLLRSPCVGTLRLGLGWSWVHHVLLFDAYGDRAAIARSGVQYLSPAAEPTTFAGMVAPWLPVGIKDIDLELSAVHDRLEMPMHLVWGDRDPWFDRRRSFAKAESTYRGQVTTAVVPGGKLLVHEEYGERFAREIAASHRRWEQERPLESSA